MIILQNIADFHQNACKFSSAISQGKNKRADAHPMTNHRATIEY